MTRTISISSITVPTRALTVRQPWAALIACGEKRIENRSWGTTHRGPLAIHAGHGKCLEGLRQFGGRVNPPGAEDVGGRIVAIVQLVDCVPLKRLLVLYPELARNQAEYIIGPFCWILAAPIQVADPPRRGMLGLWTAQPLAGSSSSDSSPAI